jgi:hypothetical protein
MARHRSRLLLVFMGVGLAALACTEDVTSPAACPDFCPANRITTVESVFTSVIDRDSTFQGYIDAGAAGVMLAASLPEVDSRPIFETRPISLRLRIDTGTDTTTGPLVIDSIRLSLTLFRLTAPARDLRLAFYRLPVGLDSTSTFASLAPDFAAAPIRVVNVDSLLAQPGLRDSVTGDSVVSIDTVRRSAVVSLMFDTTQIPLVVADSGRVALGVRVSADSLASIALGSTNASVGPLITWYNRVDSLGVLLDRPPQSQSAGFDNFVFDPSQPPPPSDSTLAVGGIPATRALLRFTLPRGIRDSTQIIRGTLFLVPAGPVTGLPSDTFFVMVRHVATDLGAKSPIAPDTVAPRSDLLTPGALDTVRIEITSLLRLWQSDTTAATAAFLQLLAADRTDSSFVGGAEGTTFSRLHLYSSRTPAFRPAVRITFIPRFPFGAP